jgi:hypothetical protein
MLPCCQKNLRAPYRKEKVNAIQSASKARRELEIADNIL